MPVPSVMQDLEEHPPQKNSKHPFMYKYNVKSKNTLLQDQSCVISSLYLNNFLQDPLTIAKRQKLDNLKWTKN